MDKKPMTKASRKHHIKTNGQDCCPYCKVEIDMETVDYNEFEPIEDGIVCGALAATQKATCLCCGRKWMDIYQLVDVEELGMKMSKAGIKIVADCFD